MTANEEGAPPREERRTSAAVLLVIAIFTLLRLALGPFVGLSVDESYAVVMSRHLAPSYFDHPPVLFWLPGLAARLFGTEGSFFVRLPFVILFMGTTFLLYKIAARLFGERTGVLTALLLNLVLFFSLNAASWILPDGPLLFFESAAGLAALEALARPEDLRPFALFGVFAGLSLLSKYHGAFLLAGAFAFLVTSPPHRKLLFRPGPYLALLLAILVFSPVLYWNATHGWASFRFQGGRAQPLTPENDTPFWGSIAGQAAWMLPWIWIPLLVCLATALRRGPRDISRWFLACLGAGPILFFTAITLFGRRGLPHWQAPGYFWLLPLLGASLAQRLEARAFWTRAWLLGSVLALPLLFLLVGVQVQTGLLGRVLPALLEKGDPTVDLLSWRPVVARLRRWGYPKPGLPIVGATWVDAAKLGYALGPKVEIASVGGDPRGFEFVTSQGSLVGRDLLLVASRRAGYPEPMVAYAPYFARITGIGTVSILRAGTEEIAVSVYLGEQLLKPVPPTTRVR
jgi:4-amino-4-deoxy-L-arabinose transferase-like glycosyltransferase